MPLTHRPSYNSAGATASGATVCVAASGTSTCAAHGGTAAATYERIRFAVRLSFYNFATANRLANVPQCRAGLLITLYIMNHDKYIFETEMEVRDYECDIQGIVNNANYLHYAEHTRHLFLLQTGLSFARLHEQGIDAVVARA